jgi:hypothetical protein
VPQARMYRTPWVLDQHGNLWREIWQGGPDGRCRLTRRLSLGRRAAATSLAHQLGLGLSSYLSPPSKRRSLARTVVRERRSARFFSEPRE